MNNAINVKALVEEFLSINNKSPDFCTQIVKNMMKILK